MNRACKFAEDYDVCTSANCYAFALDCLVNPHTGEYFNHCYDCQPSCFGAHKTEDILEDDYSNIVEGIKIDMESLGWSIEECSIDSPVPDGRIKIACLIGAYEDYHFMRYNPEIDSWEHKLGYTHFIETCEYPQDYLNSSENTWYDTIVGYFLVNKGSSEE